MKKFRNPKEVHKPLAAYSHQIEVSSSERWLVLSGQVGMKKDGSVPESPIEQLKVALDNIRLNLQAANMDINNIVKLTFYLAGQMDANERSKIINNYFKELNPCMTLLYVAALATPTLKVELDVLASCEE